MKVRIDIRSELRRGLRPQGSELTEADVGRLLSLMEGFGVVQRGDIGKRVWHYEWGLAMENNLQRDNRKKRV